MVATLDAVVVKMIPDDGANDTFIVDGPEETAVERVKEYLRSIDCDNFERVTFTVKNTNWIILTEEQKC